MPHETVAFLSQPIQMMANQGESFSSEVIATLRRWTSSDHRDTVRAEHDGKVFALSPEPGTPWKMVVLLHHGHAHAHTHVCGLEFADAEAAVEHFLPLMAVDRIQAAMEVKLPKIEPKMFAALAAVQGYSTPIDGRGLRLIRHEPRVPHAIMAQVDASGQRWASSEARNKMKDLFERARQLPQIVERRGNDDLVVMSRNYLQELVEPTSARAMAQRYRAMGLSTEGFVDPVPATLDALEELSAL